MLEKIQEQLCFHLKQRGTTNINTDIFSGYSEDELIARLSIYRNNFFYSLIDVLQDTFPTVHSLVGADFFSAMVKDYIEAHPPESADLSILGHSLPHFLHDFKPTQSLAYIGDVGLLDLYRHQSYYAEDISVLGVEDFSNIDISALAGATIEFHPSVRLMSSDYAVFSIWEANAQQTAEKIHADIAECVLVVRPEHVVETYKIDRGLYIFLQKLTEKLRIGEALEHTLETEPDIDPAIAINFLINSKITTQIII